MRQVLVADDDPLLREIAGEHLRQAGYAVTTVEDGRKALQAVEAGAFNLIITDMIMPKFDGIELIQALRRAAPNTPVIAISAGSAGIDPNMLLHTAMAIGAVSILRKPLVREPLLEQVAAALGAA